MTHLKVSNQAIWDEQIDPPTLAHHESPATHPSQRSRTSEDRAKGMPASPPTCQYQCLAAHITEVHVKSYRIDLPYVMKSQRHMQSFASGHPSWGTMRGLQRGVTTSFAVDEICRVLTFLCFTGFTLQCTWWETKEFESEMLFARDCRVYSNNIQQRREWGWVSSQSSTISHLCHPTVPDRKDVLSTCAMDVPNI